MSSMDDIIKTPRDLVESKAYKAIEHAAVHHHEKDGTKNGDLFLSQKAEVNGHEVSRQHVVRRSKSQYTVSHSYGVSNDSLQDISKQLIANTKGDLQTYSPGQEGSHGIVVSVRKKVSNNLEHYSNVIQDIAFPVLFSGKYRARSSSRSRDGKSRESKRNNAIEDDYEFVEHIELAHMDGFALGGTREVGKGHRFQSLNLKSPTWCDKCGDFIWGVIKSCLRCQNCQYTCHHKCRPHVTLDCTSVTDGKKEGVLRNQSETSLSKDQLPADDADSGYHTGNSTLQGSRGLPPAGERTLTREDLRRRMEYFNNNNHGLIMSLQQDSDTFQGFIRVHMNLIRPINMSISARPPSIYDVLTHQDGSDYEGTMEESQITSFYLPKETTKVIHIDSETTAQEVIKALLSKFKITDNPRKFALYEKIYNEDKSNKGNMRRLGNDERPLPLCLSWTDRSLEGLNLRRFILQENDTGEIVWDVFSLPELENFLKILNREEDEYVDQVKNKYRLINIQISRRLKELEKEKFPAADKREPVFV